MKSRTILILFAILLYSFPILSAERLEFLPPSGFVNDFASVMDPREREELEKVLSSFERETGTEVAVATLESLKGEPVQDVAVRLFKEWGIGKKGKDNGVLILVAPREKKMWIEIGYGLEGAINDAVAGRIYREIMVPYFRQNDFTSGISKGALAIMQAITEKEGLDYEPSHRTGKETPLYVNLLKLFIIFIVFYVMLVLTSVSDRRRGGFYRSMLIGALFGWFLGRGSSGGPWGGGFGGGGFSSGGFGGFGGGLSGGGGAGGGW